MVTFCNQKLEGECPYLWLDALCMKVRQNHRIVNQAMVIAIGVRETGERGVLGFVLGASEEAAFWLDFLLSLVRRGLKGVRLVTSESHEGLMAALGQILNSVTWYGCRSHFIRTILAHVPKGDKPIVAAVLRTIFAQPDQQAAGQQPAEVVGAMRALWPKAASASTTPSSPPGRR